MAEIIKFPQVEKSYNSKAGVNMTLTREINGMKVSINLMKLTKEQLLETLLPLPSQNRQEKCEKLELVRKYINQ